MRNEELTESIVESIVTLPTIPSIVTALNTVIAVPNSSAVDVANIISRDPSTATKVLRLANSAYYGLRSKVSTINHAVTMLGFNIVRNLVLTASILNVSTGANIAGLFEREKFWHHSLGVGVTARIVAREAFPEMRRQSDEFFICGLLHDLGKIILLQHLQPKFEEALLLSRDQALPLYEAEKISIGCTHADVGGLLAKRWNLSKEIIAAVAYHHDPAEAWQEQYRYVAVTHLSDFIARAKEIGVGGGANPRLAREAWDAVGLSKQKISAILTEIDNSLNLQELQMTP
ncbi:HDOD domain-containing protein [Candidatus Poribacteria bacterium]|nr:HDOD domain-containing protein [Candidatus Poribacteria bacterium]